MYLECISLIHTTSCVGAHDALLATGRLLCQSPMMQAGRDLRSR